MTAKTATDRAKELNAETAARAEAEGWQAWGSLVEDAEHWDGYGVHTADELDHYLLAADYWESYKEVHGIRCRWTNPWDWTDDELRAGLERLNAEAEDLADDEDVDWDRLHWDRDYDPWDSDYEPPTPEETAAEREAREERENAAAYTPDDAPLTHNPFAALNF